MGKRILTAALSCLAVMAAAGNAAAPPALFPVAVMDGWQAHETDAFSPENGWSATHYRTEEFVTLSGKLPEYAAVIWSSLAGYKQNPPWREFAGKWQEYLEAGGVLVILDANYSIATSDIFGSWGDDFQLAVLPGCIMAQKQAGISPAIVSDAPEFTEFPNQLAPLFAGYPDGWAHFAPLPEGWITLARCPDGAPFLALKPVGNGALVVSAYGGFNPESRQLMLEALVENILAARRLAAYGVTGGKWSWDNRFGESAVEITIAKAGTTVPLELRIFLNREEIARYEGANGKLKAPLLLTETGKVQLELQVGSAPGTIIRRHADVPEPVTMRLNRYLLDPAVRDLVMTLMVAPEFREAQLQSVISGQPGATVPVTTQLRIPTENMPSGTHKAAVELVDPETGASIFTTPAVEFTISSAPPVVTVNDAGEISLQGLPFFPLGIYHVSADARLSLEDRQEALHFAAANGFNTIHVAVSPHETVDTFGDFLTLAEKHGVKVIVEAYHDAAVISRHRRHPAILAWNIGDEPDLAGTPYARYQQKHRETIAADPQHPAYSVVMTPEAIHRYWPVPALIGVDPYPVPHQPLDTVYHAIRAAADTVSGQGIAPIAVLQAFGYEGEKTYGRPPTPAEARNMLFQALAAGARGVIFYTWQDGRFLLSDHPELYNWMKTLPGTLFPFEAFLTRGIWRALEPGIPGVYGAEWSLEGKTLTLLVNTTTQTVKLPGSINLAPLETMTSIRATE